MTITLCFNEPHENLIFRKSASVFSGVTKNSRSASKGLEKEEGTCRGDVEGCKDNWREELKKMRVIVCPYDGTREANSSRVNIK